MADETKEKIESLKVSVDPEVRALDRNGDGHISKEEYEMNMEFKRKEQKTQTQCVMHNVKWLGLLSLVCCYIQQ